jgi:outer membrane lipoprotein SlyB
MSIKGWMAVAASVTGLAVLSGCVVAPAREERVVYQQPPQAGRAVPVYADFGRVERIGTVQIAQRPTGGGAILGAVVGAVVGHQIGGGTGKGLATVGGAVGGAIAGNAIEGQALRADEVYRVTVRFDNGGLRDYDFRRIDDLRVGDRVKWEGGQLHRLPT